jgi:hypothetical protein
MKYELAPEEASKILIELFGLTPEEAARSTITYDSETEGISFDFGEVGVQNNPKLTAKLLRLMRVSGSTTENPIAK